VGVREQQCQCLLRHISHAHNSPYLSLSLAHTLACPGEIPNFADSRGFFGAPSSPSTPPSSDPRRSHVFVVMLRRRSRFLDVAPLVFTSVPFGTMAPPAAGLSAATAKPCDRTAATGGKVRAESAAATSAATAVEAPSFTATEDTAAPAAPAPDGTIFTERFAAATRVEAVEAAEAAKAAGKGAAKGGRQQKENKLKKRCRAAVCVSGQWRTFADPAVRRLFRANLVGGLSGRSWRRGGGADRGKASQRSNSGGGKSRSSRSGAAINDGKEHDGGGGGGEEEEDGDDEDNDDEDDDDEEDGEDADVDCDVDLFFFAKTTDAVSDRNPFFARTAAAPSSGDAIRRVRRRFKTAPHAASATQNLIPLAKRAPPPRPVVHSFTLSSSNNLAVNLAIAGAGGGGGVPSARGRGHGFAGWQGRRATRNRARRPAAAPRRRRRRRKRRKRQKRG